MRILADSNCIIDLTDDLLSEKARHILGSSILEISVISRIELLSNPNSKFERSKLLEDFVSSTQVHALDEVTILKTIDVRKIRRMKLPDAIIAATALVHNLPLYTHNKRDFSGIPGLSVVDPREL